MKVAMFVELGKVELRDIPRPMLREGEVLVEIEACGLCATDVKSILKGHPFWKPPRVLGHEMVGRVVEVNQQTSVSVGDRVFVCPSMPCGYCYFCRRGAETMCLNKKAQMPYPGGFSEYVSCPPSIAARGLLRVPDHLPSAVATLSEPLGCAVRAMKMVRLHPGATVVVVGDGPMGMMNVAAARLYGASKVIQSGTLPHRLEVARQYFADVVVNVEHDNLRDVVMRETEGYGADAVFVTVSVPSLVQQSIELVRPGGWFNVFAGQPAGSIMQLDLATVHYKEVSVNGVFGATPQDIYEALHFLGSGRLNFAPVITDSFTLSDFMKAMEYSLQMRGLRAVITPDGKASSLQQAH